MEPTTTTTPEIRRATFKVCSTCKHTKPVQDFHANAASTDGLQSACKPCLNAYQREYRKKHKANPLPVSPAPVPNPTRELISDPQYAQSIARAAQLLVSKGVPVKAAFDLAVDFAEQGLIVRAI